MDFKEQEAIKEFVSQSIFNGVFHAIWGHQIKQLAELCHNDPRMILEASRVCVEQSAKMKTLFLTVYFLYKYGDQYQIKSEDEDLLKELEQSALRYQEESELKEQVWLLAPFAYMNASISSILRNIVVDIFMKKPEYTIKHIGFTTSGLSVGKVDFTKYGYDFEKQFQIDPQLFIHACCNSQTTSFCSEILAAQYLKYPVEYKKVMKNQDARHYEIMMKSAKAVDQDFEDDDKLEPTVQVREEAVQRALIDYVGPEKLQMQDYLLGKCTVQAVYPYAVQGSWNPGGHNLRDEIETYLIKYKDREIERKMHVLQILRHDVSLIYTAFKNSYYDDTEFTLKGFLLDLKLEEVAYQYRLNFLADIIKENIGLNPKCYSAAEFMLLKDVKKAIAEFAKANAGGRVLALYAFKGHANAYKDEIFSYSADGSKNVREYVIEILGEHPEWEEDVKKLAASKKAAQKEIAIHVLQGFETEEQSYQSFFREMLEKEKNAKITALLEGILQVDTEKKSQEKKIQEKKIQEKKKTTEELVQDIHKGGKKRQLSWLYDRAHFEMVHHKDGNLASEEYLQAICLYYVSMEQCGVNAIAKKLAENLIPQEFERYANKVFDMWLEDGAQAKKKWVLYFSAIHGGSPIVEKMKHYITEWAQNSRGAIAAEAVQALALNSTSQALLIVDNISRKFKFKQVKTAAGQALEFAAAELGLTVEELSDRIIPDLGFSSQMERIFDYGTRRFTVTITPALEIEITDENGKKLKSMPAPGKKDDTEKAQASYEEFKQLKKDMKAVVSNQKMRLDMALSSERLWKTEDWKKLFVMNPIMHQFAIGLIWGIYEEQKLVQSFRYMEDGTFNTEEEEEFELPESGSIGLVHPIELTEESLSAWKEQLSDYEIVQPLKQLERPVYFVTEEEKKSDTNALPRFNGYKINGMTLAGKMMGMYWYRGPILDGGTYYEYYRADKRIGLGVSLEFSGSVVGYMVEEDVEIHNVWFYRTERVQRKEYEYNAITEDNTLALKDVPERYFSEIMLQLSFLEY